MNKNKFFLVALLCLLLLSVTCLAADKIIPVEQLPAPAKTFVKKYFPQATIEYATKDTEFMGTTYEVRLSDGTEVDFDKKGNWDNVDCKTKAVPASLVPAAIAQYVKAHYPNTVIVKIDKERGGYEIELSNDLDLKFNSKGKLIGIDD